MPQKQEAVWSPNIAPLRAKRFKGRTRELVNATKLKQRTDLLLAEWGKFQYHRSFSAEVTVQRYQQYMNRIQVIHASEFNVSEFRQQFERDFGQPCIIRGACDEWAARTKWGFQEAREAYGEQKFKCGEDDDERPLRLKLKHFMRYMKYNTDDSPLYIFESNLDKLAPIQSEYAVPSLFQEDLFQHVGEDKRPPYKWILFGPERSGSTLHIDPLSTSAWNALLRGQKLWVLFPPKFQKKQVNGSRQKRKSEDDEAIDYFELLLPRVLEDESKQSDCIMFVQQPGETVFIPAGWWHAVLNLSHTVAVTQNFCSKGNFDGVWRSTRVARTRMAKTWLNSLPAEFAERARQLDVQDGFELEERLKKMDEKLERKKQGEQVSSDSETDSYDSESS